MTSDSTVRRSHAPGAFAALASAVLRRLHEGELSVTMPDGAEYRFAGSQTGPIAHVDVHDPDVARRLLLGGSIALAEAYMDGSWDTPDLDAVLELGLLNLSGGWSTRLPVVWRPVHRLWHVLRDNDPREGSRRNISYHYDLGNDFYELWLDDTLTYSCGCLADEEREAPGLAVGSRGGSQPLTAKQLECAQRRKWDRVLELIQPGRGDRVLEIGCGWGGFAIHAAREVGCHVTGLTLSEEQARLARKRVAEQGLEDRVDIRLEDYREVKGTYSAIASIEMFEAVGEKWWPTFFGRLKELLGRGGAAAIQSITISEKRFETYRRRADFIQRYIFPGGMLPSPERFRGSAESAGLTVGEPRFFGADYARTLASWAERFECALPEIRALGFDERFIRMWRYYLAYCRTGFEHGSIDVMQVRLDA